MDYLWESRLSKFVRSLPSSEKIKFLYLSSRTSEPRDVERLTDKKNVQLNDCLEIVTSLHCK